MAESRRWFRIRRSIDSIDSFDSFGQGSTVCHLYETFDRERTKFRVFFRVSTLNKIQRNKKEKNSEKTREHCCLSLNRTPVIAPLNWRYFLRRTRRILHTQSLTLSPRKRPLITRQRSIINPLIDFNLIQAILKVRCQSKLILLWTASAGWLDCSVRWVSFYGAH
jgi:hypothetical protein